MIAPEILRKVKQLEIKTRQIVQSTVSGDYHSVFKGHGLNFSEVRAYQPGDDVRQIDWNVTAKTGSAHIKRFEEERDLTVLLLVDVSRSGAFGSVRQRKSDLIAELSAVLGFSAVQNRDRVGLLLFSDKVEHFIPPKRGRNHMFRILRDVFSCQPEHAGTDIKSALDACLTAQRKRCVVFVISDFVDDGYEPSLKLLAAKHDVIPIVVRDPRESTLPNIGLVQLEDPETGDMITINTSSSDIRTRYSAVSMSREHSLKRLFQSIGIQSIWVSTDQPYLPALSTYFSQRARRY